jgi:hypothetical protein
VKQTRAARQRRRRLAVTCSVVLTAVGAVIATQLPGRSAGGAHGAGPQTLQSTAAPAAGTATALTSSPSLRQIVASYAATRHGAIAVAVYDGVAKRLVVVHPAVRVRTASIIKVDILETLLHRTKGHLTTEQRETAARMIENSDNDAATDLWYQVDGSPGIDAYNDKAWLSQTEPSIHWGLMRTSAVDQVKLVRLLLHPNRLLSDSARRFQRTLMQGIEDDQRWGISAGVPESVTVGMKDGWLPVGEDHDLWAVNSIGWVHGLGRSYAIAVLTEHDPSKGYGIDTIEHISRTVWRHMTVASSR